MQRSVYLYLYFNLFAVAHYGVYYGRMNSHIGRNVFFCCSRYDVADILCVTRCVVSRYVDEYISPQLRASVLMRNPKQYLL